MSSNANDQKTRQLIKLQSKRNVELWIYSFADMYMILSVFFIALAVLYAAQIKKQYSESVAIASAGRGPAAVTSELQVIFESGSADLTTQSIDEIELFLPALKSVKKGFIEVEGYSDGTSLGKGSAFSSNLHLSSMRATKVSEYLIKNGVSPRRIKTSGYGDGRIWNDASVVSNRRVLIKIVAPRDS